MVDATGVEAPPRVEIPNFVVEQLRARGLAADALEFGPEVEKIIKKREKAEQEASKVKTLEDAISRVGLEDVSEKLRQFDTISANPQNLDTPKKVAAAFGDVRIIASRLDYMVKALHRVPGMFGNQPQDRDEQAIGMLGQKLTRMYLEQNNISLSTDENIRAQQLNDAQKEVAKEISAAIEGTDGIAHLLEDMQQLASDQSLMTEDMPALRQKIKDLKAKLNEVEAKKILGLQFINKLRGTGTPGSGNPDLETVVFETYTVNRPDWYNESNTQNMENAIIEAAKFAGGDYVPNMIDPITHKLKKGGKYAMYTEHEDGSIDVHLENVNEYIIFRIAEHMAFQDPDDPIEVLNLRLFETSFRSVTLYEFFIHDASKYAQMRTHEAGKQNPLYQDFLMYWSLQASSSGHIYNTGIQARKASNSEDEWKDFYAKMCRTDKLTAVNRFPRELRKLSREDMREQIALTGRLKYDEWKETDGRLGQAISDYASVDHYIFELSHGGWNIEQHLDAVDKEEDFLDKNADQMIPLDEEIGRLTGYGQNPKPTTLTRLVDQAGKPLTLGALGKRREGYNNIIQGLQNAERLDTQTNEWVKLKDPKTGKDLQGQNYVFKLLSGGQTTREGRRETIVNFLTDLVNNYMEMELGRDSDPNVKDVMARAKEAGASFIDILQGNLPKGIKQEDRNIIVRNIIIRGGIDRNGNGNYSESKLKDLMLGDFGTFAQTIFSLEGNSYKREDLNGFSSYGSVAKDPMRDVVSDTVKAALARKFSKKATAQDETDYENLLKRKKEVGETDKSKWTRDEQDLADRVANDLTAHEIDYAYESAKEIAEWTMRAAQNDTGVGGNRFAVRIAHPGAYFLGNFTNLNVGDKETIDVLRNSQDMLIGVPISVHVTDKKTKRGWREMMWLGEFMERGMYSHRQTRTVPQFGEHSLSTFFTRRVEAALKVYTAQRDPKNDVYMLGQYLAGYVLGDAEYTKGLEQYTNNRNVLNDLLFTSKYPLPYKRLIREWVTEGVGKKDKKKVSIRTMKTEEYMLGRNVFLLEDIVMSNPDIKRKVDEGEWGRGEVLETMTEMAMVMLTLKRKTYFYLKPEEKKRYETGTEGVISSYGLAEAFNTLAYSYIGGFGAERRLVQTADGRWREDIVMEEGQRFTEDMAKAIFSILAGVSLDDIRWKEIKQNLSAGSMSFLFAFLGAIFSEMGKGLQGSLK